MLSTAESDALQWTSVQPNIFTNFVLDPAVAFVKHFRKSGEQGQLRLMMSAIDGPQVGILAAKLLLSEDPSQHNHARYVLNGSQNITGGQVV
jgi:hypothetical protein